MKVFNKMKLKTLKILLPIFIIVMGVSMVAIGGAAAQDDGLTFSMVSHGGPGNSFWNVVIKGMDDACALLDANCQWLGDETFSL
jgi:simple sugar transport system substrate-binding protein